MSGYGLFRAFYFLSFSSYLYQVRGRHCEKRARRSYLQLNMSWSNSVPIVATFWFSCSLDKTKIFLLKQPKQVNHVIKNNNYLLINHDHFLTKYFNTLTDQPLSKHYRVKLDLDGLRKARYPRITKTATKRVSVLSLCCDQRQDHL